MKIQADYFSEHFSFDFYYYQSMVLRGASVRCILSIEFRSFGYNPHLKMISIIELFKSESVAQ